jgi:hypothetical protein
MFIPDPNFFPSRISRVYNNKKERKTENITFCDLLNNFLFLGKTKILSGVFLMRGKVQIHAVPVSIISFNFRKDKEWKFSLQNSTINIRMQSIDEI